MSSTYLQPDEPELNPDKKRMLLEFPPPIAGQMSTEIERIRRVGDFQKTGSPTPSPLLEGSQAREIATSTEIERMGQVGDFKEIGPPTPSPSLEGSQARDVATSIVTQKDHRRVLETAEGIDPPSTPAGSGKSGRIDKPSP